MAHDEDDAERVLARRKFLKVAVYVAPAVATTVHVEKALAIPPTSCGPSSCNPNGGSCGPSNCPPQIGCPPVRR